MANNGHAPQWLTKMSTRHVPYAAILAIGAVYLVGIVLNIFGGLMSLIASGVLFR